MKNWLHDPVYFAPIAKLGGGWILHKDSPAPPPSPDYAGAATAQGAANVETARAQGRMNNPNVYTPYGSQTVTWGQGQPVFNQGGYDAAMQRWNQGSITGYDGDANPVYSEGGTGTAPSREQFTTTPQSDQATITQKLSPAQQTLLDSQNRISQNLSGVAESGLNRVSNGFNQSFDTSRLPGQQSNVNGGTYQTGVGYNNAQNTYNNGGNVQYGTGYNNPIQNSFDAGTGARTSSGYQGNIQGQIDGAGQQQNSFDSGGPIQTQVRGQRNRIHQSSRGGVTDEWGGFHPSRFLSDGQTMAMGGDPSSSGGAQTIDDSKRGVGPSDAGYNTSASGMGRQAAMQAEMLRGNGLSFSGAQPQGMQPNGIQSQVGGAGQQQTGFNQGGQVQSGLNFSGAPQLPGTNDFSADRDAVTNALLARSEPQFQRDEELTRTRLMNQGLAAGSEASNYDLDTLNRARNDARNQAVLAGGQEQSRLFGLASQARGQYTGEQAQQGQFANNAQSQQFNQGLAGGNFANAAQQAQFGQNLSAGQFANQAQAQGYGQDLSNANFANSAQAQQYGQNLGAAQFANTAQQNQFAQNQAAGQFANTAQAQGYGQSQQDLAAYNAGQAQNYAQNQGAAAFGNAAQAQGYTQAQGNAALNNAAQGQANTQNQQAAAFGNQAIQQNFGMGQQNAALNNQTQQQLFTQGLANANLGNQARQTGIQEQAYLRSLPLNELNALRTGSQVTNPQFQPYQGVQLGQTPVFNAAQAQAVGNQGLYNAQQGAANSFNSGLMSMAGTAAGGFFGGPAGAAAGNAFGRWIGGG